MSQRLIWACNTKKQIFVRNLTPHPNRIKRRIKSFKRVHVAITSAETENRGAEKNGDSSGVVAVAESYNLPLDYCALFAIAPLNNDLYAKYESWVQTPPDQGYTEEVLRQRKKVLQKAYDIAREKRWTIQDISEREDRSVYVDIEAQDLVGALVLMQELGYAEEVLQLISKQHIRVPEQQDLDIVTGLCHFDVGASHLKQSNSVLQGVQHLEAARRTLKRVPPETNTKQVLSQIQVALSDLRPQYLQEVLALPITEKSQQARELALQEMQEVLNVGDRRLCMEVWKGVRPHLTAREQILCHQFVHPQVRNRPEELYYALLAQIAEAYVVSACSHLQQAQNYLEILKQSENYDVVVKRQKSSLILEGVVIRLMLGDFIGALQLVSVQTEENDSGKKYTEAVQDFLFEGEGIVCQDDVRILCALCVLADMFLNNELKNNFREFRDLQNGQNVQNVLSLSVWYSDPQVQRQIESKDVWDEIKRKFRLFGSAGAWVICIAAVVWFGGRSLSKFNQRENQMEQTLSINQEAISYRQAKQIIKRWQKAKANALGENYDLQGLSSILDKKQLEQWRQRADDVHSHGWNWNYILHSIKILSVEVIKSQQHIQVELLETAELKEGQKSIDTYYSRYMIEYVVQYIDDNWKIVDAKVIPKK